MNAPSVAAAIFVLLIAVPAPLVRLDALFHRWLVRRIVNASGGKIDDVNASDRIRMAEGIEPRQSASIFAGVGLVAAGLMRSSGARYSAARTGLVLALSLIAAVLASVQERAGWVKPAAFLAGATALVAML